MFRFNRPGTAAVAAVAALGAMALAAPLASATTVEPPATEVTLKNVAGTTTNFAPNNGANPLVVECEESSASLTTPTEPNNANPGGSVEAELSAPPTFEKCSIPAAGVAAKVETSNANGDWTANAEGTSEAGGFVAIGVPKAGATIETPLCTITVTPDQSSAVFGSYDNASQSLEVDGQIDFAGCGAIGVAPPAVFEGQYEVVAGALNITP